ncbi:MAG TPA: C4-type zinc ribbon domain-containing protein [Verrucomicrobiae bacterium]|nr:C4-type zinc ribbon domain-containing protein [Verrucomicrobiae bacterium]
MNELLQNLIKLQSLEFGEIKEKNAEASMAELRGKIPPQIIAHYDRLVARGKKGVAAVRNQVCTGCHMRVPIGVVTTLMHDTDIQICESCGRYLYLTEETGAKAAEGKPPAGTSKPKPVRKARKPKSSLELVSTPVAAMPLVLGEGAQSKTQPGLRSISG